MSSLFGPDHFDDTESEQARAVQAKYWDRVNTANEQREQAEREQAELDARRVQLRAMRTQLEKWAAEHQGAINAADAKASTLLGWSGTALALVATAGTALAGYLPQLHWTALVPGVIGVSALAGCVMALIQVIRPRLGSPDSHTVERGDRSFLLFAGLEGDEILRAAELDTSADLHLGRSVERVQVLSAIALTKHQLVRTATTLLQASMPVLAVAGLLLVLTGGAR